MNGDPKLLFHIFKVKYLKIIYGKYYEFLSVSFPSKKTFQKISLKSWVWGNLWSCKKNLKHFKFWKYFYWKHDKATLNGTAAQLSFFRERWVWSLEKQVSRKESESLQWSTVLDQLKKTNRERRNLLDWWREENPAMYLRYRWPACIEE